MPEIPAGILASKRQGGAFLLRLFIRQLDHPLAFGVLRDPQLARATAIAGLPTPGVGIEEVAQILEDHRI
jgi:hypothetical protein